MFREFERVRIKTLGITGVIVDRAFRDGGAVYIVESDERNPGLPGGYGDIYPLFDCSDADLEAVG